MRLASAARRVWLGALCSALAALAMWPTLAGAAPGDPAFVFYADQGKEGPGKSYPSPGGFEGPCGLAVDVAGNLYVSDYYRDDVDVFKPSLDYLTALSGVDPLDGPCGLALGAAGRLYVNDFHRSVLGFTPSSFPLSSSSSYGLGTTIDPANPAEPTNPTGVAVDGTGNVYVNDRTYIAVYEPSGEPVLDGGSPLRIGLGSLGEGYGVAVSSFAATKGYVYVPDAADDTVKVYDPATDTVNPIATIDGALTPEGAFVSLRDSAVAVDPQSGRVYVADDLQPAYYEHPEAAIYAFDSAGAYAGRLKYNIVDARPPGLTVAASNGRVYVTSGNTEGASVYAYESSALTKAVFPAQGLQGQAFSSGSGSVDSPLTAEAAVKGPLAEASEIAQKGKLRVSVSGRLSPNKLPRSGEAPVAVRLGGRISTTDGSELPQLKSIQIEFSRGGRLEERGLPTCGLAKIKIASSARALSACRDALVGSGRFEANIVLSGQEPYPTSGRLLIFNGRKEGKPALLGHIYAAKPFATSFVIAFTVVRRPHGRFGTALSASLPDALGDWGYLTAIEMRLSRHYSYRGERRSFINAGCPAPKGFPGAIFTLARMSFAFAGGHELDSSLTRSCRAG